MLVIYRLWLLVLAVRQRAFQALQAAMHGNSRDDVSRLEHLSMKLTKRPRCLGILVQHDAGDHDAPTVDRLHRWLLWARAIGVEQLAFYHGTGGTVTHSCLRDI